MNKKYFAELVDAFLAAKSRKEMEDFLRAILTPKELAEIPTRLQIVKMLKKGVAQRDIADKLKVGVATVTRGSLEIKKGSFRNV